MLPLEIRMIQRCRSWDLDTFAVPVQLDVNVDTKPLIVQLRTHRVDEECQAQD